MQIINKPKFKIMQTSKFKWRQTAALRSLGGGGGVRGSGRFPGRTPASGKWYGVGGYPRMQAAAKHLANPRGQEKRKESKRKIHRLEFPGN